MPISGSTTARPAVRRAVGAFVTRGGWLWVAWAPAAVWALARVLGLEGDGLRAVQLMAFTPYAAAAALLPLAGAVVVRRWRLAAVAGVTVAALVACVAPRAVADAGRTGTGPRLRVLTVNMRVGGADPAVIVGLVRDNRVDLLAVQELTTAGLRGLDAAGLAGLLPHRVTYLEPNISGLFSRFPLRDDGVRVHLSAFGQARATVSVPGAAPVAVESVHPCAPIGRDSGRLWAADLADQPSATVDSEVRLLIGDFNATLDHAPLRRLLATGYRDAGDVRGGGFSPTWPADYSRLPGVTIDHVLADRRVGVSAYDVFAVPRTDHRAVFAELVLPRA